MTFPGNFAGAWSRDKFPWRRVTRSLFTIWRKPWAANPKHCDFYETKLGDLILGKFWDFIYMYLKINYHYFITLFWIYCNLYGVHTLFRISSINVWLFSNWVKNVNNFFIERIRNLQDKLFYFNLRRESLHSLLVADISC